MKRNRTVNISDEVWFMIKEMANEKNESVSSWCERAIPLLRKVQRTAADIKAENEGLWDMIDAIDLLASDTSQLPVEKETVTSKDVVGLMIQMLAAKRK